MGVTYDQVELRVVERLERYVRQIAAFTDWGLVHSAATPKLTPGNEKSSGGRS